MTSPSSALSGRGEPLGTRLGAGPRWPWLRVSIQPGEPMEIHSERNVICDKPSPGVRVIRFVRPDLRPQLYEQEAITDCSLYRELDEAALADLAAGET